MPQSPSLQAPRAIFSASLQGGTAPLTVVFTNTSTGTISGYAWSFGDGKTSADASPTHIFEDGGDYVVSLTVWNAAGASTDTYRIDVAAPQEAAVIDREETLLDLVPSIRAGLRRPSEQKLRLNDILDVINDLARGYSRDLSVSELEHNTAEADAVLSHLGGSEYLVSIPGISDVEINQLKFLGNPNFAAYPNAYWYEIGIVPLDYYAARQGSDYLVGATYGGMVTDSGLRIKLSMSPQYVAQSSWRARYRVPLIKLLTLASKTGLPAEFLPMFKVEARLMLLQFMRDDSKDFMNWRRSNESLMVAQIGAWRKRWDEFLNSNTEPDIVRKISANDWRRKSGRYPPYSVEPRRL